MARRSALVVVPARLSSQRLHRKMLLAETGLPLVEHTRRAAAAAVGPDRVVIVTDSEEIAAVVRGFGGTAVMTSPEAASGTARIVEALPRLPAGDIIVNVQGDEPEIEAAAITASVGLLEQCHDAGMSTVVTPLRSLGMLRDPAVVKAVLAPWHEAAAQPGGTTAWRAIYFSRLPVPAAREWSDALLEAEPPLYWQHVGLYAYRRSFLEGWDGLPESRLATLESLEQLRVVEAGIPIAAAALPWAARGIDTPEDYAAFVARVKAAV
jgi:3-deoxy-manno-octulosonate cytidylyltransferase (CMP-KDO synthetase)